MKKKKTKTLSLLFTFNIGLPIIMPLVRSAFDNFKHKFILYLYYSHEFTMYNK